MLKMNRFLPLGVVALSIAFVTASIAEAQQQEQKQGRGDGQRRQGQGQGQRGGGFPGGGFGRGGADRINLVGNPQIRTELKISEEQQFFVDELLADHREKTRGVFSGIDFSGFRDKPEEERRKVREEINAKRRKIVKQNEEVLAEFLTDAQNKRLGEITLQLRGTRAMADAGVAKQLGLSEEQTQKIQAALKAADDERRKMFEGLRGGAGGGRRPEGGGERPEGGERRPPGGGGGFDFNAMREKMEAARKKTDASVLAILSSEQKKKYEAMKGAAFTLERGAFGRGRGGEGGGRRREGDGGEGGGRRNGEGGGDRPRRPAAE
jgi:hypothetical protein